MDHTRVKRCLDAGMSLLVATVNAENVPSCCRAIALASADDLATVTVYLPLATSHETVQNIATTRRLAIAATYPPDNFSIQLKGTAGDARLARDEEAAFVRSRLNAFADVLDTTGIPRRVTANASCWPAFAVDMRVEQVFDQTPGPNAGTRVR
jgi:hypothetical protein